MDWLLEDVKQLVYAVAVYAVAVGSYWIFVN
jgi:hypothetical protein